MTYHGPMRRASTGVLVLASAWLLLRCESFSGSAPSDAGVAADAGAEATVADGGDLDAEAGPQWRPVFVDDFDQEPRPTLENAIWSASLRDASAFTLEDGGSPDGGGWSAGLRFAHGADAGGQSELFTSQLVGRPPGSVGTFGEAELSFWVKVKNISTLLRSTQVAGFGLRRPTDNASAVTIFLAVAPDGPSQAKLSVSAALASCPAGVGLPCRWTEGPKIVTVDRWFRVVLSIDGFGPPGVKVQADIDGTSLSASLDAVPEAGTPDRFSITTGGAYATASPFMPNSNPVVYVDNFRLRVR